jgi:hypothetical protein
VKDAGCGRRCQRYQLGQRGPGHAPQRSGVLFDIVHQFFEREIGGQIVIREEEVLHACYGILRVFPQSSAILSIATT